MTELTVLVPAYNEADGLGDFHASLAAVLDTIPGTTKVLYVDDGSSDGTWAAITALGAADARVTGLRLSRNFGKEAAMTAGLDNVDADAVVVIDADLQDPPELIPELLERWRAGYDVVYATRRVREGESGLKRLTSKAFYRVMEKLSDTPVPRDTGDFRLLSRRAVEALRQLRERQRFMRACSPGLATGRPPWSTTVTPATPARPNGITGACGTSPWRASPRSPRRHCGWPPGWA